MLFLFVALFRQTSMASFFHTAQVDSDYALLPAQIACNRSVCRSSADIVGVY